MAFQTFLTVTLALCCVKIISSGLIIPDSQQKQNLNQTILDYSCFDADGIGYTGKMPHTTNCGLYLECTIVEVNSEDLPISILNECTEGLEYSWKDCACLSPGFGLCFDAHNPEHEEQRFNCATPILEK